MAISLSTIDNLAARLDRIPITKTAVRVLILLELAWIIEGIDIGVSGPVIFAVKHVWHLNPSQVGVLGAAGTLGIVLGLIPSGYLADRFGRKPLAVWGLTQFTIFTGLKALAPSYEWFVVLLFLDGLGLGVLFAIPYLMMSEFIRAARRGTTIGWENGILEISYVIPALLAAWAVSHIPLDLAWRVLLGIATIPLLYAPILAIWLPESPRWLMTHGKVAQAAHFVETLEREAGITSDPTLRTGIPEDANVPRRLSVKEFLTRQYFGRGMLAYCAYTGGLVMWYGMLTYGPILFNRAGFSTKNSILMLAYMMFIGSFGNVTNGYLSDRIGRKYTLAIFAYCSALGALVMAFSNHAVWILLAGAVAAFFGLGGYPVQKMYIAEQFPTRMRGLGTTTGEAIGRFLGGVLAAYYIPDILAVGGTRAVFLFIAASIAVLVIPALVWGRETANLDIDALGEATQDRRGNLDSRYGGLH